MIWGTLGGVLLFVLGQLGYWPLHYVYNIGIMLAVSTLIFVFVSKMSPAPSEEQIAMYTYRKELINAGMVNVP